MTDVYMRILLSAQDSASSVIRNLAGIGGVGGLIGVLGALTVAMGVVSTKTSANFQQAMDLNVAHAGLAKDQVNAVSDAVLNMAPQVGKGPTELAQSLYPILSGLSSMTDQTGKAQVALAELRLASESVAGSTTSATKAASAGTAVFNALGLQTNSTAANIARMNMVFDQANATVTAGNMQWEQYANVAGKLATSIKGTTVTWTEASSALATLTNEGFSAQRSQTYLANLFTQLDLKTDSLAKNAKKLGIAFDEQRFKSMSLAQQMDYLKQVTGGNESEILKLLNNNATALKTYNALESGMNSYKSNLQSIGHAQGATASDFAAATSNEAGAAARLRAAFDVLLIRIGDIFLPVVTALENAMTPVVITMANMVQASSWLSFYFSQDLSRATEYLTNKMYLLWDQMSGHGKLLDTFQQTVVWMRNVGTPAYLDFAHVVGDVTGGAYQKLQRDALTAFSSAGHLSFSIAESIALSLKNINWGAIFAQIPKPTGAFAQILNPLGSGIGGGIGNIISFFKQVGSGIMAALQPFIDEWHRITTMLQPDFAQFAQWWNTTIMPMFDTIAKQWQGANTNVQGFHLTLKDVLDAIGDVIVVLVRIGLIITEYVLPPILLFIIGMTQIVKTIYDVGEGLYDMAQQFMGWLNMLYVQFVGWIGHVGQAFSTLGTTIYNALTGGLSNFGSFLQGLGQDIMNAFKAPLNWIIDGINRIIDGYNAVPKFGIPNIPDIPQLASGGYLTSSGIVDVHANERLFLPAGTAVAGPGSALARGSGRGGGGHTFNITINAPFSNPSDVSRMVDLLEVEIARRFRSQTPSYSGSAV